MINLLSIVVGLSFWGLSGFKWACVICLVGNILCIAYKRKE